MGRLVESYRPNHLENQNKLKIDVSGYQQGTYFVKLIDSSGQDYQKQMLVKRPWELNLKQKKEAYFWLPFFVIPNNNLIINWIAIIK